MNAGWERITGLARDAVQGRTLRETIPEVEPEWITDFVAVAQTGVPANFTRHIAAMGRWYEVHAFRPEPGRFAAVFLDITDRHIAQLRLLESEQRLQFVMDSMPQKIFTVKPTGEVDYLNPQWAEFSGRSPDAVRDWAGGGLVHPDDLPETLKIWQHSFATGKTLQMENRFRRADGHYCWHINRLVPLRDATGGISMWIGSSTDIDEQKEAARTLQKLADALSEADRRKSEFLATLAHELRNPLAPISNALHGLQRLGGGSAALQPRLAIMQRQVAQLVRLVDDLLDVSRITQGRIELRLERTDLAAVLAQAIETCEPTLQADRQRLTLALGPDLLWLDADPMRLAQVFGNLINNAVRYGRPGGHIDVSAARDGSCARVSVKDDGIGTASDKLASIFEMFSQVDSSAERARGGLGIGLMLVQNLVQLHGGTVEACSGGLGQGSEFIVRLPLAPGEHAAVATAVRLTPALPAGACRVLVVDDNADAAQTLAELLDVLGFENRVAFDGTAGLREAEDFKPDLVLLDIGMPGLSGYEVARMLRATPWGQSMRLVALTGWGQVEDRQKSREAGFDRHLVKPLDFAVLMQVLGELGAAVAPAAGPRENC